MLYLPEEIIKEILRRLPVKPLLRFRSVSKAWRSLIDSKQFIRLHLHHSLRSSFNHTLLVDSSKLYHVDLDSFKLLDLGDANIDPYSVIASCDGLVLLVSKSDGIALWNPSVRMLHRLPEQFPSPEQFLLPDLFKYFEYVQTLFALGYDAIHDDYKVVRVVQAAVDGDCGHIFTQATVYSHRSNSWKRASDFPYLIPPHTWRWGLYLNGALHTAVDHGEAYAIMAFDLGNEEHRELPMPQFGGGDDCLAIVEVMSGLLALMVAREESTDIWLMKEYGVKKSWMKLLRFEPPILFRRCLGLDPLAYSNKGDEVLLNYDGICLYWYNLRNKSVRMACVNGVSSSFDTTDGKPFFDAVVCVGSLVSPCGNGNYGMEVKKEKKSGKKRDDFLSSGFKLKL